MLTTKEWRYQVSWEAFLSMSHVWWMLILNLVGKVYFLPIISSFDSTFFFKMSIPFANGNFEHFVYQIYIFLYGFSLFFLLYLFEKFWFCLNCPCELEPTLSFSEIFTFEAKACSTSLLKMSFNLFSWDMKEVTRWSNCKVFKSLLSSMMMFTWFHLGVNVIKTFFTTTLRSN